MLRQLLIGAAAGAAGTTALNAVTYLDMAVRGRPASDTPERSVQRLAALAQVEVPGGPEQRQATRGHRSPHLEWARLARRLVPHAAYGAVTAATYAAVAGDTRWAPNSSPELCA
ncbi:MAG: hypothetical protein ACRDSL_19140 [Pseudonocardiaceae bacterium]